MIIQPARLAEPLDAARAGGAALAAIRAADLVLIPCRPSAFDLAAIATTRELVRMEKKAPIVVLSAAPMRIALVGEARDGLAREGAVVTSTTIAPALATVGR